jgi:DNA-binding NarL/FixJ family response regulator
MTVLSDREIQIIQFKAQGFTAKEISRMIGLEYRTIEVYISNIRKKLEAKNMVHAICIAMHKNMLKDIFQLRM